MAAITVLIHFEAQENKVCHGFHASSSICQEVMGPDAMIIVFYILNYKLPFSLSSFTSIFSSSSLSAVKCGVICISEVIDTSLDNLDFSLCFIQSSISHDVHYI